MSTHEQITNNPTSAVRNTGGRNGLQVLEEPMSDDILREMCDKNYHQLLPLIAEKMLKEKEQKDKLNANLEEGTETGIPEAHHRTPVYQLLPLIAEKMLKEKEQKDKLNAVKARLIYGEESGIKIRSREESHYSESKTPTARTEPRRRHRE
ncbi:hypothetical protein Tco_1542094, partial [Tanacetum coccineum]